MGRASARIQSLAEWTGAILVGLFLVLWIISIPIFGGHRLLVHRFGAEKINCSLSEGTLVLIHFGQARSSETAIWWAGWVDQRDASGAGAYGCTLPKLYKRQSVDTVLIVPLWLPLLLTIVPTGLAWRRRLRRAPHGHCLKCHYNLTGNKSGICPECGTATSSDWQPPEQPRQNPRSCADAPRRQG